MFDKNHFKVGQILYVVKNIFRPTGKIDCEVTIQKIGNKFLYLSDGTKAYISDLHVDNGQYTSCGRCYISRDIFNEKLILSTEWLEMQKTLQYMKLPEGVTIADLNKVKILLKL